MTQVGNIGGFPLLQLPATPGQRTVDWNLEDVVGSVENPFTLKKQIQAWQTGRLSAVVTMPQMQRPYAAAWLAFLAQAMGQQSVFYFGDGLASDPQGSAEGNGVIDGIFQQSYLLTTNGWTPNQMACLTLGDWIQVGWRLYMVTEVAPTDGAGNCAIAIWPQMREQPASGTPIITTNPQGLFRLSGNMRKWSESYTRTWSLSFAIEEALF
jgi:hypothetical protein